MRRLPILLTALVFSITPLCAADKLRIGVVVPLTDAYKPLADQVWNGAVAAQAALGGPDKVELVFTDDHCDAEGGKAAGQSLAAQNVHAVLGFLCTPALIAALPELRAKHIPVLTLGARSMNLSRDARKNGDALFRLGPNSNQESEAIANLILPLWRDKNFAIIDDGTLHSRDLAESLRIAAEGEGLKPVFVDTFRPALDNQFSLINRLKKSGATHVFIGGDRDDVAIIARDAKVRSFPLTIAGGETLAAAPGEVAMADGVLMVGLPDRAKLETAKAAVAAATEDMKIAEGYFLPAYAALEIIVRSIESEKANVSLAETILKTPHETIIGPVRFTDSGDLSDNPYRLLVAKDGIFQDYQ